MTIGRQDGFEDCSQEPGLTEQLVAHLGYLGIALILVLGGLGLPIPEEAPVILAGVLSRNGKMVPLLAFATCLAGVLLGDFVVYFLGYYHGEKVLNLPVTRRLMTRGREAQIKGYFHRHGFKILILGRFAVGFRTAAYLTAGILKLPPLKLFLTDLVAASLSTSLMFGLAFVFAQQIQSGIREAQQWFTVALAISLIAWLSYRFYRGQKRAGLPVGPPVLFGEEPPLPPDDLKTYPDDKEVDRDPLLVRPSPSSSSIIRVRKSAAVATPPAAPADTATPAPSEPPVRGARGDSAVAPPGSGGLHGSAPTNGGTKPSSAARESPDRSSQPISSIPEV
jgi:membrane protein DedA with SNARE-associated domain